MIDDTTSLAPTKFFIDQWRHYVKFLRRPQLPADQISGVPALKGTLSMLMLDILIMMALLSLLFIVIIVTSFDPPSNVFDELKLTSAVILGLVIVAPLLEEIGFRSWLSGKAGHLIAVITLALGIAGFAMLGSSVGSLTGLAVLITGIVGAIIALVLLRKRPAMVWFAALFPVLFWLSTIAFALIHLANYREGALAALLPLVLPQAVLGSICGYLRVHYGLWSSMFLHALHNGLIVLIVLFGSNFLV